MKNKHFFVVVFAAIVAAIFNTAPEPESETNSQSKQEIEVENEMQLGNFSVSLAVKDIQTSKEFYEKLGFRKVGGVQEQNWLILQNGTTKVGLFQGMFESNLMTFNPGWDENGDSLKEFVDIRTIQAKLKGQGVEFATEAEADGAGPASFVIADPDGNTILFDQHVDKPQ